MNARARAMCVALTGAAVMFTGPALAGYCPSYTPALTAGGQNCGIEPALGKNPDVPTWHQIFKKVSGGKASWGTDGPDIGTMGAGCGHPNEIKDVPAKFPCHVLKAIAMRESFWQQFCVPTGPGGEAGKPERTIVSFDCGYGIGQVTSGMHVGETPNFDRQRVASDPTYNLATGTLILLSKWRAAECVGDNNPELVEDWYTAIWAYNGFAFSNNPNNPNLDANRGVYDPDVDTGASHTYQEFVYGWMEHPHDDRWAVLAAAYPNRGDIGGGSSPGALPEPKCASPTDCTQTRPTHTSSCGGANEPVTDDAGAPGDDAGVSTPPTSGADAGPGSSVDGADASDGTQTTQPGTPADGRTPPVLKQAGESGCSCRTAGAHDGAPPSSLVFTLACAFGGYLSRRRRGRSRHG